MNRYSPLAAVLTLALAAPAAAQEVTDPDLEVDTVALTPGDALVIRFEEGFDHQLLRIRHRGEEARSAPLAQGEVRASLTVVDGATELRMENGTAETLYFDALADRRGSGGFAPVPTASVAPGETIVAGRWPFPVHTLTVGEFSYGPHGDHQHQ